MTPSTTTIVKCKRCKYSWKPQTEKPNACPNCKSLYWDTKRQKLVCALCGHKWFQKDNKKPKYCPNCNRKNWNDSELFELAKATKRLETFNRTGEWID